jgi:hypothetical protein
MTLSNRDSYICQRRFILDSTPQQGGVEFGKKPFIRRGELAAEFAV